jgi:hypothetical protein
VANSAKSASASASKLHQLSLDGVKPNKSPISEAGEESFGFEFGLGARCISIKKNSELPCTKAADG